MCSRSKMKVTKLELSVERIKTICDCFKWCRNYPWAILHVLWTLSSPNDGSSVPFFQLIIYLAQKVVMNLEKNNTLGIGNTCFKKQCQRKGLKSSTKCCCAEMCCCHETEPHRFLRPDDVLSEHCSVLVLLEKVFCCEP